MTSGIDTEIQLTIESMIVYANALQDVVDGDGTEPPVDTRQLLHEQGFSRAATAAEAAVRRTTERFTDLLARLSSLPGSDTDSAVAWVNGELTELTISPSVTTHEGADFHIHWTPSSATFDDQVMADVLMALAQELCDHGTKRFGTCGAVDCNHLFFDTTRNGSKRFCSDPRCASRTHTADHRKRRKRT